jgi:hypothetical protein
MEALLDILAAFLATNVVTTPAITWIIGDPGQSAPTSLPFGYIVPLFDTVKGYTSGLHGVDMDTYMIPILVVDDLHNYGPPTANQNAPGTFEQPGYRKLMQYGQAVRGAHRGSAGAGIVLGGSVATSAVPAISYVWVTIDSKPYRGVRVALQFQQRRSRQ